MAQSNSFNSKATSLGSGILQVARMTATSVIAITAVLVLAGIALGLTGCSKEKSNKSSVSSSQPNAGQEVSKPQTESSTQPATSQPVAKKRTSTPKRASTLTYSSNTYGVSFRFPSQYELSTPGNADVKSTLSEDVPKNFAQPGGVTVATIELPSGSATSFFNVSANKGVTSEQCEQFSIPSPSDLAGNSPVDENDESIPSKTNIHGVEFTKVENATEQEDVKYYHHFEPGSGGMDGTCYEFALGVEQSRVSSKTLDYQELFNKLERVMATVKIKSNEDSTVTATVPNHEQSGTSPQ